VGDERRFTEESAAVPAATVTLVEGASFVICDAGGDIVDGVQGLFVADTRVCSRLELMVEGQPVEPLTAATCSPFQASFAGRTSDLGLLVLRDLRVSQGMRVDIRLRNLARLRREAVVVQLCLAADLAHLFAVKEGHPPPPNALPSTDQGILRFRSPDGQTGLAVWSDAASASLTEGTLSWTVSIEPGEEWSTCLELAAIRGGQESAPRYRCGQPPETAVPTSRQASWEDGLPRIDSDIAGLTGVIERTGQDLGGLRLFDPDHPDEPLIAAGAPWYMTLFGRDSLLTSWMALMLDPAIALGTVRALARLQGIRDVAETEEQPGRILHEVRFSPGPSVSLASGETYYGTADATPLFVMLVHELWRWGVPLEELASLLPAVDAALDWIAGPGDPDGDGYVEYAPRTAQSLSNQGWKDSYDGVSFADGRLPEPPIALVEVQAYVYAAWRAGAALASATGDEVKAAGRAARADALRRQFDQDFWMPQKDAYAMALDGDKRPVDGVGSNMGHCLWTGIVADHDKAAAVARWLSSSELFCGWGVRTLATSMARYNPLSYHNGSVWPHDTAICIAGLRRAGFVDEAVRIASATLTAARVAGGRPPELFAGLTPEDMPTPVPYPASCSPQAWASAAPLLVVRALLGLEPDIPSGRVLLDPVLPGDATHLRLSDMPLGGRRVTIEVDTDAVAVRNLTRELALIRPAT
jgi:glycogen debranching enzyme